jgi:hypothetical protein
MARFPQSDKSPVALADILLGRGKAPASSLGGILQHAGYLAQLQQLLEGALEPALSGHFQVANARQNRLILLAPSAVWATRLRMQAAGILEALQRSGHPEFDEVEVRVAPLTTQQPVERGSKPLSPAAEQALGQMARLRAKDED